ncbi:hypothetical protein HYPSUDRAFT_64165 [Hypholoma sublateritium FD-334 SS-4]|uniref:Uncharacterized protein n=1 Tax=Hypholoma sublateritium (strain FD-334 SS-4) TaxID=945553 RepID=A0A0D2LEJ1_HYPSF|nr:hypothetical protein HYPSUDRAFT_64165 [Hypholoma sublateritium FD-334 SS-4]
MNQTTPTLSRVPAAQHWPVHLPVTPILEDTEIQCTKFMAAVITFKTTDIFVQKLECLVDDRIVNEQDWSAFITFCFRLWKCCIFLAIVLIMNTLHFVLPVFTTLALVVLSLAMGSIISALLLIHVHQSFINPSPAHVYDYTASMISPSFGFQLTGLVFSFPLSVLVYAWLIFALQWARFLYV